MNIPKWIPTNPCDKCERQLIAQMESSFTLDGKCICLILAEYTQKIEAQRQLLEYLTQFTISSGRSIPYSKIQSMLKQLQETKNA